MKRIFTLAVLACAVLALTVAPSASAGDTICTNQVLTGSHDNVKVAKGATCTLFGATLKGNYDCDECSFADSTNSTIGGNYNVKKAPQGSIVFNTTVRGNYEAQDVPGFGIRIFNSRIGGNLKVESAVGSHDFDTNTVGGNLEFYKNTGTSSITNNTITGGLKCKENSPPPTGGGNTAAYKEDQCAGL